MRKMTLIFIMMGVITFTVPSNIMSCSEPPKPKLDCNKMVSELIKAVEDQDFKKICLLRGKEYTEKKENWFNEEVDELYEKWGGQASFIEKLHLIPEIGELPEWVTWANFEFQYIEGNNRIELNAAFVLKNDNWIIDQYYDLDLSSDDLSEKDKRRISEGKISPSPAEGEKTLDVGLNEIIQRLVSDYREKNWDSITKYTRYNKHNISRLKKKGEKFGELLSQFPLIGPIPAPAIWVGVDLKGTLEGKKIDIGIKFEWEENKLIIEYIGVEY